MKKTIVLLLAAAGMALGATPMNVTWDNNTANFDNSTEISAIFTLDVTALSEGAVFSFLPVNGELEFGLFNIYDAFYGENAIYDVTPSVNQDGTLIDVWVEYDSKYKANNALIAYTFKKGEGAALQFTMFDSNGVICYEKINSITSEALDFTSIATIQKHAAVGKIDIYNVALQGDEITAAIDYLLNPNVQPDTPGGSDSPAAPEPTTATLSLLALAGLAARRRRR